MQPEIEYQNDPQIWMQAQAQAEGEGRVCGEEKQIGSSAWPAGRLEIDCLPGRDPVIHMEPRRSDHQHVMNNVFQRTSSGRKVGARGSSVTRSSSSITHGEPLTSAGEVTVTVRLPV